MSCEDDKNRNYLQSVKGVLVIKMLKMKHIVYIFL